VQVQKQEIKKTKEKESMHIYIDTILEEQDSKVRQEH